MHMLHFLLLNLICQFGNYSIKSYGIISASSIIFTFPNRFGSSAKSFSVLRVVSGRSLI